MHVRDERIIRFAANRVRRALKRTHVSVTPRAFRHLVGVLCLPVRHPWFQSSGTHESLTMLYRRGTAQPIGSPERAYVLGLVGDASLLRCGFWWERDVRRHGKVSVDNLMQLGKAAYGNVDDEPYHELASNYGRLADTMIVLAAHYIADRDRRVVALCGAFAGHADARLRRLLDYLDLPPDLVTPSIPS